MPPSDWNVLDFEKPIMELDAQIAEIKRLTIERGEDRSADIEVLELDRDRLISGDIHQPDHLGQGASSQAPQEAIYARLCAGDVR